MVFVYQLDTQKMKILLFLIDRRKKKLKKMQKNKKKLPHSQKKMYIYSISFFKGKT